jgi:hypothetical protein
VLAFPKTHQTKKEDYPLQAGMQATAAPAKERGKDTSLCQHM